MPKQILVAIDFTDGSRAALDYGSFLARRIGAHLTALHVTPTYFSADPLPAFPEPAPLDPERQRRVLDQLSAFLTPPGSTQPVGKGVVRDGDPADEILAQAAECAADLVVLGTHGRRGFERWILGSVTERLVRRTERPVLTVPASAGPAQLDRVLCAVDLSPASAGVLEFAAGIAHAASSPLQVLYVASDTHWYEPWPIAGIDIEAVRQAVAVSARERLAELVGRIVPASVPAELRVAFGNAPREITRASGEAAGLVVIGASATSAVDRFFFGSTAQHVLRSGVGPVLLYRHPPEGAAPTSA